MLDSETYSLGASIERVVDRIDELEDALEELDDNTDEYEAVRQRRDRLAYFRNGLQWQRDEAGWGDASIEVGALTAGEKALMYREAPDEADVEEMRLWFVAACTADAPYHCEGLSETFAELTDCHPAFVEWVEAKANSLGIPGGEDAGNGSSESSPDSSTAATSTTAKNSPSS